MIHIDLEGRRVVVDDDGIERAFCLDSPEAFEAISRAWVRSGWEAKYTYTFSWFGRPVIQLPEDMIRTQEVLYRLRPDVVVETGVAHGGSLVFYASLFEAMGHGRVIGVDIEIRPHNRRAIEEHELFHRIDLIEGSSTDSEIFERVRSLIAPGESVIVFLDSNHSRDHVRGELDLYSRLVNVGSFIVATDGVMKDLVGAPRAGADWGTNNPETAAREFLREHPEFVEGEPPWPFDESAGLRRNVTHWPGGWLRRIE